ncbi:hypothetical protein EOD10_30705 [Mesorhizobium sp. M7A.T.Ca.TU.009.01.3.2]|jgi:hypothetical protein|uniref:hypothetical protein n=1 Tax=unclassified Mesorhizobium TaxID=325217 RepID=UPI000FCA156F|nr:MULTISPECIES: hypothetical protein [unclassified Mesorhizobium]RUU07811.1 hypothetical protein EOD10_30705 [Mesorhizobium sp. M7A.T.Ca.TU.009.01.3.2]RUV50473.1 hypothetical protein EOB77_15065 [Mesorhizobium sp. M7A.F.Ca.MR.228.00.0.0]RUV19604.1 hypothetical protein EOB80_18505 [Mesorhizobium sp. M7A.F.Ca.MR.245.00.0.0]RWC29503.1 MAG: hypothetical protein EOS27_15715 [Mesorhizobium sp.]RWN47929.1 MAG: hypothetical protein EOS03_10615 [Mesorhizobium sp.]
MASGSLVRTDIDAGINLIRALDEKGFGVAAALWLYNSDVDNWRMIIAYRGPRKDLEKKYLDAATIAADWRKARPQEPILDLSKVKITSADDRLIAGLGIAMRVDGLGEVRFSHNTINGIYVEDALIHRLAA